MKLLICTILIAKVDLSVLKTIQEYVDNKKIEQLYIETHGDDRVI